jgi:uncharacterized Fe-S cluster protein YjdI
MKKPRIRLTNIKYHEGREGTGVNMDIHINGVKCLHMIDAADGGCFRYYNLYDEDTVKNETINFNVKLLDEYIESLPLYELELSGRKHNMKHDRDSFFNMLLEEHEQKKQEQKITKLCKTSIVVGNKDMYAYVNFKRPLSQIDKAILIKHALELHSKYCTKGEMKILNKNLTSLGVVI